MYGYTVWTINFVSVYIYITTTRKTTPFEGVEDDNQIKDVPNMNNQNHVSIWFQQEEGMSINGGFVVNSLPTEHLE